MCVKCRATLPISPENLEDLLSRPQPVGFALKPEERFDPVDNEGYAGGDPDFWFPLSAIFIVACLLSGFLGFILGRLQ